jgi:hypothetical protein
MRDRRQSLKLRRSQMIRKLNSASCSTSSSTALQLQYQQFCFSSQLTSSCRPASRFTSRSSSSSSSSSHELVIRLPADQLLTRELASCYKTPARQQSRACVYKTWSQQLAELPVYMSSWKISYKNHICCNGATTWSLVYITGRSSAHQQLVLILLELGFWTAAGRRRRLGEHDWYRAVANLNYELSN